MLPGSSGCLAINGDENQLQKSCYHKLLPIQLCHACVFRSASLLHVATLLSLDFASELRREVFDSPAPTAVILSWTILSVSGVPGSAAGHGSRVPRQHEREPTETVKGIRLQFQQEPPASHSSQQQTHFKEILPTRDVTCFNAVSLRERTPFVGIQKSAHLFLRDGLHKCQEQLVGSLHFHGLVSGYRSRSHSSPGVQLGPLVFHSFFHSFTC